MSSCVGLVYFQSLLGLRLLTDGLGVNGQKKKKGNWDIINKNEHNTFHTGKPENFNILRKVFLIIL